MYFCIKIKDKIKLGKLFISWEKFGIFVSEDYECEIKNNEF